jgi:mannonate dehydratase
MKETWRWFGPQDPVSLENAKQAGATGIVSALHHLYRGEAWPLEEVLKRKAEIEAAGLMWSVVESIPIHNSIKLGAGSRRRYIEAWKDSVVAVGKAGVKVICYHFMPIVDWTRTDLKWRLPSSGYALRFDVVDFAIYDVFILRRKNAENDYSPDQLTVARLRFEAMSEELRDRLEQTIIAGLPAAESTYDRQALRGLLSEYEGVSPSDLQANLTSFLQEVAPVAEAAGVRLAIHPDDPPWSLFGVPRVVSTAGDVREILSAVESTANGLTFCAGSYGARADNNLLDMVRVFASRIHFAHLRQVMREADRTFHEAEHLACSSQMVGIIHALMLEEARRREEGRADHEIPLRPDHGHILADDLKKQVNPGYSLVGRLKGLAELRGAMRALEYAMPEVCAGRSLAIRIAN